MQASASARPERLGHIQAERTAVDAEDTAVLVSSSERSAERTSAG